MERGKTGPGRGSKNKIAPLPSDFIALGSKGNRGDATDAKRPGVGVAKTTTTTSTTSNDRKKEGPPIQSMIPSKKPKLAAHTIPSQRPPISYTEAWEVMAIDCEPADLVPMVLEANDNDEGEKLIGLICGAIKNLRNTKYKPDNVICMGLLYLVKVRPSIFDHQCILHGLASLLKKDLSHQSYKNKNTSMLPVLVANLLMRGFQDKREWPIDFVKSYIDDALGERTWVDNEECKGFVDNILTGFNTRIPPKSVLQSDLAVMTPRDCSSPSTLLEDEDSSASLIQISGDKEKTDISVIPRYIHCSEQVETIVLDVVKEQLNRRQPDSINRNFLKLLSSACGFVEIRNITVPKLEMWLHNPKLMRSAQELLSYVCYNCTGHTMRDVEVISHLVKMRLKTKSVINLYLNGVKELIGLHPENLATILKHTIYNELSNARNPNNMPMIAVMFQTSSESSAKLLGEIFQDLLINREDYLRPLRALLREIVRVCRYDINLSVLARTLMSPRVDIIQQLPAFEFKERMFSNTIDLLCLCMFLAISPQVKEAAALNQRGDKKDVGLLHQFQNLVANIQLEAIAWLQSPAPQMYNVGKMEMLHAMHKIMLLEPPEQYCKPDNFPPDSDRAFYMRTISEVPLLESTLIKLLIVGYSKENGITHPEVLELADQLVRRAALCSTDIFHLLHIDNTEVMDLIFNLCTYQPPASINIPLGYQPPTLAISNLYWKGWVMLLMLAAHNPSTIGAVGWEHYPILRVLMEMCITNHFSYPPPSMALPEVIEEERTKEFQVEATEKDRILEYETYLAAASTRVQISEQNSLLLSQLITMDPMGIARRPPQLILDQIQSLNTTHRLGHLLCRSRKPDFLLDIIQRQQSSSSQSMPWLAGLVQNSEGSLSQLPVQCLCEFLLSSTVGQADKQSRQQQLLTHLQLLLTDPLQDSLQACEVLEYFLRRLSSQSSASRMQAIAGLKLVLNTIPMDDEVMEVDGETESEAWLLRKLPSIPHFPAVRTLVSKALRGACQVENNPELVQAYISYLAAHTPDDDISELIFLVNEISQLVVERNTIVAAILPQPDLDTPQSRQTLHAFLSIYCNYLDKARAPRQDGERVTWSENQDLILVEWATGEGCTMHILVVHAMIILLTYDQASNDLLFKQLLETWFPTDCEPPKAFLVDTSEEALLIPDWLKLRIIRSNIPRLVDAALRDLDPYQLVLFIQSFGVPVNAMTKLLHLLDAAVQIDPVAVTNHVLDKTYMAQLVRILHNRGAAGGLVFLEHIQLQAQQLPDESPPKISTRLEQLPSSLALSKLCRATERPCTPKTEVPTLINQLFIEKIPIAQKTEAYRKLHKILAKDLQRSGMENERGTIVIVIKHILSVLSSIQANDQTQQDNGLDKVKEFLSSLVHMPQYSCTLMRVILLPLKKSTTNPITLDLARSMCLNLISLIGEVNAPILAVLRDFASLRIPKRNDDQPQLDREPAAILESAEPQRIENVGRKLLDICMKQHKNDSLVEGMAKLLVADSEQGAIKPRTGLLIDWLALVEPELIGTCPSLQMRLLFGKTNVYVRIDESVVSSHSCRPYLLTLLTHGASWATLYKCVGHLLDQCHDNYDPTAVLDFLWALTCNPKLWQGREKYSTKNDIPENILLLTSDQLLVLVMYLIEEAVILCERQNRQAAVTQMETRLDLLLCCISSEDELTMSVVKYLAEQMSGRNDIHSDMAHQFLLHLYMKVPKIIYYLSASQSKKMVNKAHISDWTRSVLDCMSHTLLTSLATLPRQKSYSAKSRELELCARKMAAVHPLLVLRQLPLLASSLTGLCDTEFSQFRSNHHLNLYTQVMGLLELLQPHLFNEEHKRGLEDTLENFFQCFQNFSNIDDLTSLLNRFALLLQAYVVHDEQHALRYLQRHAHILHDLQGHYLGLESLRSLVAGIPIPREGENPDSVIVSVNFHQSISTPMLSDWSSLLTTLTKIQGDDVYSALQEIEHLSSRKPSVLEPIVDNIADLLVSPQGNIRILAHSLIARALKQKPYPNFGVLSAFQRCLDSSRADILMSALDKLPDYVLCMQEYALPLMQKVFELGVNSNVNTIPYINKSVTLLNTQKGC
ncbi:integrator complex subunit 1 isoform X2 [Phymastichus coffea]|uniref:integrator complex subunit 1 isoform X2 n=1 Tax=Phymastichus coffea TaxID=108790 RepID=UPI00273CB35D|nr:integrator complex subunit 1 isoform X2 [Phymastichus coffea]